MPVPPVTKHKRTGAERENKFTSSGVIVHGTAILRDRFQQTCTVSNEPRRSGCSIVIFYEGKYKVFQNKLLRPAAMFSGASRHLPLSQIFKPFEDSRGRSAIA